MTNASVLKEEAIFHGINLSNRMDASLEVLHLVMPETTNLEAKRFEENTAKLNLNEQFKFTQLPEKSDFTREAIDFAKNRRNLLCVILCTTDREATGKHRKKLEEVTKILRCPVVLYTGNPVYL